MPKQPAKPPCENSQTLPARAWPWPERTPSVITPLPAGIADADKAAAIADHLLSQDMFSGWRIRMLVVSMVAYNLNSPTTWLATTAVRYGRTITRYARSA